MWQNTTDPVRRQQTADPIPHPLPVRLHAFPFAIELTAVLGLRCRHVHDAPDVPFATHRANQHADQRLGVEPIGLRLPPAPAHPNARRVDNHILYALRHEPPMQPESIAARFIAAVHRRRRREVKSCARARDFRGERRRVTRPHLRATRPLAHARRRYDQPGRSPELQTHIQRRCDRLLVTGRRGHKLLLVRDGHTRSEELTATSRFHVPCPLLIGLHSIFTARYARRLPVAYCRLCGGVSAVAGRGRGPLDRACAGVSRQTRPKARRGTPPPIRHRRSDHI